jgi:hypothetical protein
VVANGDVRGDAESERRLSHARPGRDDDEVALLEARGQPVEVAKAGGDPGDVRAGLVQCCDSLEALLQQRLDVGEVAGHALLGKLEDDLLRAVDEL